MGKDEVPGEDILAVYERALPVVYGYLVDRCGEAATAEDLTSETFLAALSALRRPEPPEPSIPWLVGVARHKLVDHWRRRGRQEALTEALETEFVEADDPWDDEIDRLQATAVLEALGGHHRAALTLRYVDALPVAEVADALDRTYRATEALLGRAKTAFRRAYAEGRGNG